MSDAVGPDELFEARYSIPRLLFALAGTLAFVAASLFMLRAGSWFSVGAGCLGIGFFGFVAGAIVRRLFNRRVQIRVDAKGVMIAEWSDQVIAHRSIKGVRDLGQLVGIVLHKPEKYPTTNPLRRVLLRIGGAMQRSAGDIYIVEYQYDRRAADILAALDRLRPMTAFEQQVARVRRGHGRDD